MEIVIGVGTILVELLKMLDCGRMLKSKTSLNAKKMLIIDCIYLLTSAVVVWFMKGIYLFFNFFRLFGMLAHTGENTWNALSSFGIASIFGMLALLMEIITFIVVFGRAQSSDHSET